MITATRILLLTVGVLAVASELRAQAPAPTFHGFVNVNVGTQGQDAGPIEARDSFSLYGETATFKASQGLFEGGAIFDLSGGYRVWRNLAVAIGFSNFSDKKDGALEGSIPNPTFFNRLRTVSATASDLEHSEHAVYFQAVWFQPLTDRIEVSFGIGPSFVSVSQDIMSPIADGFRNLVPAGTQNLNTLGKTTQEASATGAILQFDATYLVKKYIGAGIFLRRNGATVNLPSVKDQEVGGFQFGVGARARF